MSRAIMEQVLKKIKAYDRIMLFRHIRCDGDALGATKGLCEILRLTYPEKEIYLVETDRSAYLAFLGDEDKAVPDALYTDALGIVLDTGSADRISNPKYTLCRELIKIDHHIERDPYADLCWVESERSSTCEMVARLWQTFRDELKINRTAATYLYTGMVTDSGRFRFRSVSGTTLRCAAEMLDLGVDTEQLYANLYLQDFDYLKFKAYVYDKMKITPNGVAYLYVTRAMQEKFNLTPEDAAGAVGFLDSIKGSLIWIAFIESPTDRSIRVRLRSRFLTINEIAERYHGGGHSTASGATVYSRKEAQALIDEADAHLADFKANNTGWM